ncbi:MAG: response regulator transcription factor [Deltaproteobacteria bacterium]|jgi:DNA-binding response OmpR family regulator|nr:response regulator transcription factor [Deltaproteobacteria bacterium]
MKKNQILIIEDDEKLVDLLTDFLTNFGFQITAALHPQEGLDLLSKGSFDLIILDVMLPDMDGFEVCKQVRKDSSIPIVMLTARGDVMDKVVGLEIGADDYLAKPFEPRELVARIQSVLRRTGNASNSSICQFGDLSINLNNHDVKIKGNPVTLTSTEFQLLQLFIQHPDEVLSRDLIMESVQGIEWESYNRSVDVLVSRLRQKLGDDPKHPRYLKTIWGSGYLFFKGSL